MPRTILSPLGRRLAGVVACSLALSLVGIGAVEARRQHRPSALPPLAPPMPLPLEPEPSTSPPSATLPSAPGSESPTPTHSAGSAPEARTWRPVARGARARPATANGTVTPSRTADLAIGRTVGLQAAERPGSRIRHRKYVARVDPLGPSSSSGSRADSRFTVRAGLTGDGCVSLESDNSPGRFLRHRNFVIRLDADDDSALFAKDATFCVEPRDGGGSLVLRSVNYPDRLVTMHESALHLSAVRAADATAFVVLPPL